MRPLSQISALLVAVLALVPCAFAEEAGGETKEPEIKVPEFSVETLVPKKDALLEGWLVLNDDPIAGHPSGEALMALAEANGLDEDTAWAEHRIVKTPAGGKGGIVMMDIDADPSKFRAALDAKATETGWAVVELAVPKRLLIVGGEPALRDEIRDEIIAHIVYEFTSIARDRLNIRSWDKEVTKGAKAASKGFIMAGRRLSPEAGALYAIESFFDLTTYRQKRGEAKANKEKAKKENDEAKEEEFRKKHKEAKKASEEAFAKLLPKVRKALDPNIPLPPRGTLIVSLAGQVGGQLLERKDAKVNAEAASMLEIAVKGDPRTPKEGFGNRYNLACAYARLGEVDKAFEWLRKSLELGKLLTWRDYGQSFIHMEEKDDDMKPLRKDGRWEPLVREFRDDNVKKFVEHKKKMEERKKKEQERRKKAGAG